MAGQETLKAEPRGDHSAALDVNGLVLGAKEQDWVISQSDCSILVNAPVLGLGSQSSVNGKHLNCHHLCPSGGAAPSIQSLLDILDNNSCLSVVRSQEWDRQGWEM